MAQLFGYKITYYFSSSPRQVDFYGSSSDLHFIV